MHPIIEKLNKTMPVKNRLEYLQKLIDIHNKKIEDINSRIIKNQCQKIDTFALIQLGK